MISPDDFDKPGTEPPPKRVKPSAPGPGAGSQRKPSPVRAASPPPRASTAPPVSPTLTVSPPPRASPAPPVSPPQPPPTPTPAPQNADDAGGWLALVVLIGIGVAAYNYNGKHTTPPPAPVQPSNPALTSDPLPPVFGQPAYGRPANDPPPDPPVTPALSAAVINGLWLTVDPARNLEIHSNLSLSAATSGSVRARIIARFYMGDGSPMPVQNGNYEDFGMAAVVGYADVTWTEEISDYVLQIPGSALAAGQYLSAVVSVENSIDGRRMAEQRSTYFNNVR